MNRQQMFIRMMLRSAAGAPSRSMLALLAVVVVAAVATALLNIYIDSDTKLHKEFRSYGANIVVTGQTGFSADELATVEQLLPAGSHAAPFGYAIAKAADQRPVIVAGIDVPRTKAVNGWWQVGAWPESTGSALVGARALKQLSPNGEAFELTYGGKLLRATPAGTLHTGSDEDSRVYLSLADFEQWTGVQPSVLEVSVAGGTAEVENTVIRLRQALPQARVEPVRQMVEAEASVLEKTRGVLLGTTLVVIVLATMCLLATLTASVLDRRKDFAVMRALGASRGTVHGLFLAETATIALLGCFVGMAAGVGLAMWIGAANFHAAVTPRWSVLPLVLAGTLLIATVAAVFPMMLLGRAQPAELLRGE
jgi:putative ABC transport system permease protein